MTKRRTCDALRDATTAPGSVLVRRYAVLCPIIPEPHWQTGL